MRNKRSVWCIFSILVLVAVVGFVGAIPNARASEQKRPAGTDVSGIISTNTVWNLAGSPYNLTGKIQVAALVTLTIESGVVVNGNDSAIEVFGTLRVSGSALSRAVFNDVIIAPGTNSYNDPPFLIDIEFADMNRGQFSPSGSGYYLAGALQLRDSRLVNTQGQIYLWFPGPVASLYIERNVFYRSGGFYIAMFSEAYPSIVYIRNNVFLEQQEFAIKNIQGKADKVLVEFNSFLSSDRLALYLPSGYANTGMTAINNYWGGVSSAVIDSIIFDKNDDLSAGSVINYLPVLSAPHPDTPLFDPPAPTPTSTSTETSTPTSTSTSTETPTPTSTSTSTDTSTPTSTATSTEIPTPSSTPAPTQTPVLAGMLRPRAYLPSAFRQVPLPTMTPTSTSTPVGSRADDFEPNDSLSEVLNRPGGAVSYINVGSQIAGVNFYPYGGRTPITVTGAAGDIDWYFFYGKKFLALGGTGGCYQIKTAIQPGVDTDISIYSNPPTNLLAHNDDIAPLNRSSQINLALPDDGTYWIKVLNLDSTPRGVGQAYNLSVAEYLPTDGGCAVLNTPIATLSPTTTPNVRSLPLLDSFDRADGSVGTNWIGNTTRYVIRGGQLISGTSGNDIYNIMYWAAPFSATQEVAVRFAAIAIDENSPSFDNSVVCLMLKWQAAGTIAMRCHAVRVSYDLSDKRVRVEYCDNEANTWEAARNGVFIVIFVSGDTFGAQIDEAGLVQVFKNGASLGTADVGGPSGWNFVSSPTGKVGLWYNDIPNVVMDDFAGK